MHHAFIDKLWREWQQGKDGAPGRGNDFGGRQPADVNQNGFMVSSSTIMEPWGTSAQDTLDRISGCVGYANADGSVVSRKIALPSSVHQNGYVVSDTNRKETKGVAQVNYEVVPVITEEEKDDLQLEVAKEKIQDPKAYEAKVLRANQVTTSCVEALKELRFPESYIALYQRLEGYGLLKEGGVDLGDVNAAKEAENTGNIDILVIEGEEEKEAIEQGKDLGEVNPGKTIETTEYAVVTSS